MSILRTLALSLAGACLLALPACSGDDALEPGTARVNLYLTDAPGDVLAAVVTIDEIYLQGSGGRQVLSDEPITVNLLDLVNTASEVISGAGVPAGTYSDLRFVISGAYIEVETATGSTIYASAPDYEGLPEGAEVGGDLQMPSLGASGLKVQFDGDLVLEGEVDLLVDFDVAESFGHQAGNSGKWVMHPVIKGATVEEAATATVTLALGQGVTLPVGVTLANFTAVLDGKSVAFADSEGTFKAAFAFLLEGTYELTVNAPVGFNATFSPALPVDVVVGAGASVTQALTLTAITPAP